jgi:hypothetical protein
MNTLSFRQIAKCVLPGLAGFLLSIGQAHADFQWPRPNTPGKDTLIYFPFDGSLNGSLDGHDEKLDLFALEDMTKPGSKRHPDDAVFSESAPHLGKALSLKPENLLRFGRVKLQGDGEFTVSFWVKISEPGYLMCFSTRGVHAGPQHFAIGMKVDTAGILRFTSKIGESKWQNQSDYSRLLDGAWHHVAVVVKPDSAANSSSKVLVAINGEPLFDFTAEGVAQNVMGELFFGCHPDEYYVERSGPGATCLIDEVLVQAKAIPKPNQPL